MKLDYHQIAVPTLVIYKTVFIMQYGHHKYIRICLDFLQLLFLKRCLIKIFESFENLIVYLDYLLVYSTEEQ